MERQASGNITEVALSYPSHQFKPEDLMNFVQASKFSERWDKLGLTDHDLQVLEVMVMSGPKDFPVIKGTGGLRKLRIKRDGQGKRSGFRVCYVYFEEFQVVHLLVVYGKNEQDNLDDSDKKVIKTYIAAINESLSKRNFK